MRGRLDGLWLSGEGPPIGRLRSQRFKERLELDGSSEEETVRELQVAHDLAQTMTQGQQRVGGGRA